MIISRRAAFLGIIAAPAIVRASSLMPVKAWPGSILLRWNHGMPSKVVINDGLFRWEYAHIRIYDRVLTPDEVVHLAGGKVQIVFHRKPGDVLEILS